MKRSLKQWLTGNVKSGGETPNTDDVLPGLEIIPQLIFQRAGLIP